MSLYWVKTETLSFSCWQNWRPTVNKTRASLSHGTDVSAYKAFNSINININTISINYIIIHKRPLDILTQNQKLIKKNSIIE